MSNKTRCICAELDAIWMRDGIDRETFGLEVDHQFLWGHYASCNCDPPEPRGILNDDHFPRAQNPLMKPIIHWPPTRP